LINKPYLSLNAYQAPLNESQLSNSLTQINQTLVYFL